MGPDPAVILGLDPMGAKATSAALWNALSPSWFGSTRPSVTARCGSA